MDEWMIYSHEHLVWWGPDCNGYARTPTEAGLFSQAEAQEIVAKSLLGWHPELADGGVLPHTVAVRADSFSLVNAVAVATVQLMQEVSVRDEGAVPA